MTLRGHERKPTFSKDQPNPDERGTKVTTIEGLPLFLIQIKKKIQVKGLWDRKDRLSCSFGAGSLVDLSHSDEGLLLRQW